MVSRFEFIRTPLEGLTVVERRLIEDHRGFLARFYCAGEFAEAGVRKPIAQINHTLTRQRGTVRGMHFQRPPHAEMKIVSCLRGSICDVVVDVRRGSPTFLQWHGEVLSAENRRALVVPEGMAHGFQALSDDCEILYLVTAAYAPDAEGGLLPTDPRLDIRWPLPITDLSERDRKHPVIALAFEGVDLLAPGA